jgi:hypothetical protein
MQTEAHEQSFTFSKPTTLEAILAAGIALGPRPPTSSRPALRVTCAGRLDEDPSGARRVCLDYSVEAWWTPPGMPEAVPGWNDITRRSRRPENNEAARLLFAESEEEACEIDAAIEKLLHPLLSAADTRAHAPRSLGAAP